jgi:hypothetical protein
MVAVFIPASCLCACITSARETGPVLLVIAISVIIGLLMVLVFRYTSDQNAIRRTKDQLKAHLLAVRLFQDQLPVVLRAYGRIFRGTGHYLRLAFTPLVIVILPLTFLIVELDRYLGWQPLQPAQAFLVEVRVDTAEALNQVALQLPPELATSAPPVHVEKDKEVAWRVVANREGRYNLSIVGAGQPASKQVIVSGGLAKVSPVRLRDNFWERMFSSAEPALPNNSPIQSIGITYSPREVTLAGWQFNWIVLFFVLSLVAGFIFKTVLRIQV